MIAGLNSVRGLWRETYKRVEFQKPSAAFVERLIGKIALPITQHQLDSTLDFSLRGALQLLLMDEDREAAHGLLSAMNEHSVRIVEEVLADQRDPMLFGTEALVWLAAARTMAVAEAPDRALLRVAAESTVARFSALGKRKSIAPAGLARIQFAAYAALLAGELELFRVVLSLRSSMAHLPQQWTLLQMIAETAGQSEHEGRPVIRCSAPHAHERFLRMFQLHRHPSNQHVQAELGAEGLLAGGQLGGYVYTWMYLQCFAPAPSLRSDWSMLRELLIG
jgi:hypothetical protein